MLRLSVCIEALFAKLPYPERIKKSAELGAPAFEFWSWSNKNLAEIKQAKDESGIKLATFMCEMGSPLVEAGNRETIIDGTKRSIEAAKKLACNRLLVTTGNELEGVSRAEQHKNIVEHLKAVAGLCEDAEIILNLEPLNILVNHKGYYLYTSDEGFEIVDEVGSPNVKLLYDIYHQQITEGNLIATIEANIDKIGHFHLADVPGRHEPTTGEINYGNIFKKIAELDYDGFVGMEFWPIRPDEEAVKLTLELADSVS
ncbi:TPA: hydroxypyruvate isomerase [Candidatus Poribacteria bacterium]|nr:hydroxypyruvate isomerase [Candidatus Poribacteria bacterium]